MSIVTLDSIVRTFETSAIRELVFRVDGLDLQISKSAGDFGHDSWATPPHALPKTGGVDVPFVAPSLGTIRDFEQGIGVGARISPGQIICHIAILNEVTPVRANEEATVKAIHAEAGKLIEFGQTLMTLNPA